MVPSLYVMATWVIVRGGGGAGRSGRYSTDKSQLMPAMPMLLYCHPSGSVHPLNGTNSEMSGTWWSPD